MLTTTAPDLPRTSPEQQGIASAAILEFVQAVDSKLHEMHSFMLLRHGSVVAEGWWSPYGRERRHMMFSLSKSFTSTAVGLAVAEGRFTVDDPVLSFFPDEKPVEMNEHWAAMKVRHLLSMSTGHDVDTWSPTMIFRQDGQWTKGFFEVPVLHEPGTHFLYNTGATYLLSAIVQKTTGQKLVDYLQPRLFEPLGIEDVAWDISPEGISLGGTGLHIRTEDIARFGQLYLQKGRWQGQRLLPEAWVEEASSFHVSNGNDPKSDWAQGYGYQFWRCKNNAFRGDGAFGQYCIVMPEKDAVLAITSGLGDMQQPLDLVWDILLPAMKDNALPEDAAAQDQLAQKLSNLSYPPPQGNAASATASKVSGKTYTVEANDLKIETFALEFGESQGALTIKAERGEETIPFGYGEWQYGRILLFNRPWETVPEATAASGVWTKDNQFTLLIRLNEATFVRTLVFDFAGESAEVESSVNVSFDPLVPIHLKARLA